MRHFAMLALLASLLLGGCTGIYRQDTEQGNIITDEMVAEVKAGMTRSQVRYVLGTPLVADPFHHDRWDYYYLYRPGSSKKPAATRYVTVYFENDRVSRIETGTPPLPARKNN